MAFERSLLLDAVRSTLAVVRAIDARLARRFMSPPRGNLSKS